MVIWFFNLWCVKLERNLGINSLLSRKLAIPHSIVATGSSKARQGWTGQQGVSLVSLQEILFYDTLRYYIESEN